MRLTTGLGAALAFTTVTTSASAQNPQRHFTDGVEARAARAHPVLHYTLDVSATDTIGFDVRILVRNAPKTFRIAMPKHPEYDDRFFRFVTNVRASGRGGASVVREDSMVWRVAAPGGEVLVQYRIALPPAEQSPRAAWRPFLSPSGGLTGGPHAFMYVIGAELAPAHVTVNAGSWAVVTGLTPTGDPRTFFAANAYVLVESPILVGRLLRSTFTVDGTPHTIAYWPAPGASQFDTAAFRTGIERLTREAIRLFGRAPYREYVFQIQDAAYGGLEHPNSVTLGIPSAELARDPHHELQETAHEFIHTWNLMRIRPAEYRGVTHRQIEPVPTLWFSEGLTMMYADVLMRRAGLATYDSTRMSHLEGLMARYTAQPGNARFSAEQVSRVSYNAPIDALGDYNASAHLLGELVGIVLDFVVRDATNGLRSMDDVMRLMLERFGGERGMTTADIEAAVRDVCGCNVKPFFDAHIRGGGTSIDFNRYLGLLGLRAEQSREATVNREGQPSVDFRLWARNSEGDSLMAITINDPSSDWGRAGLHTNDRLVSLNGNLVRTWPDFRRALLALRVGDTARFVVRAPGATSSRSIAVPVSQYRRPAVRISLLPNPTEKQRRLRDAWLRAM